MLIERKRMMIHNVCDHFCLRLVRLSSRSHTHIYIYIYVPVRSLLFGWIGCYNIYLSGSPSQYCLDETKMLYETYQACYRFSWTTASRFP
jgi:hypothetical protein